MHFVFALTGQGEVANHTQALQEERVKVFAGTRTRFQNHSLGNVFTISLQSPAASYTRYSCP
jgi:hypothetical protein